jgi:hypothetical protein
MWFLEHPTALQVLLHVEFLLLPFRHSDTHPFPSFLHLLFFNAHFKNTIKAYQAELVIQLVIKDRG